MKVCRASYVYAPILKAVVINNDVGKQRLTRKHGPLLGNINIIVVSPCQQNLRTRRGNLQLTDNIRMTFNNRFAGAAAR